MESKTRRILVTCISAPIVFIIGLIIWVLKNPTNGDNSTYMFIVLLLMVFSAVIGFADYKISRKWIFILFCVGLFVILVGAGLLFTIYVNPWAGILLAFVGGGMFIVLLYYTISMLLQTYIDRDNILLDILYQLIILGLLALWLIPKI